MTAKVSIVIRTLNESKHLENLMIGIHDQNYTDWEIVLVDSGSTDGTLDIAKRYGARIFHIPKEEFTFGRSLNIGCQEALGDYLVFASGHVWPITNNWLRNLVKPFEEPSIAMVYGRQRGTSANRVSETRELHLQFGSVSHILVDEPKGNNGNAAIRRNLWYHQPFDETLTGLEDVDWARKAERNNLRVYYAADASVYHVHEETLPQVYHRYYREAVAIKRMFPDTQFKLSEVFKGLPNFIIGDIFYALRMKHRRNILQIPASRVAQFFGKYQGMRQYKANNRKLFTNLEPPESLRRVEIDTRKNHSFREIPVPKIKPHETLVKVGYIGVCHHDSNPSFASSIVERGPSSSTLVPGHEYSAIVVAAGNKTTKLKKGDMVAGYYGSEISKPIGAYSDYMIVPSRDLKKLPPDMPLKYGALVENVATCVQALSTVPTVQGGTVCVLGASSLGNICAQILWGRGFKVTVQDSNYTRLSLLYKYEISTLVEPERLDRFDLLVDTTENHDLLMNPSPLLTTTSIILVDPSCVVAHNSDARPETTFPLITERAGNGYDDSWREAIDLIRARRVKLKDHTSEIFSLTAYQEAWSNSENDQGVKRLLITDNEFDVL